MFEITDLATIIQVVSLAVASVSGVATLIYFLRNPRETEEYAEDHQSRPSRRSQNQINETVPENPSPPGLPNFEQPPNIVPSNMVPLYVPIFVPKSTLDEILQPMSNRTSRTLPLATKFAPSLPPKEMPKSPKSKDLSKVLIRRVGES